MSAPPIVSRTNVPLGWFGDLKRKHLIDGPKAMFLSKLSVELCEWPRSPLTHGVETQLDRDAILIALNEIENVLINIGKAGGDGLGLNVRSIGQIDLHGDCSLSKRISRESGRRQT